MKLTEIGHVRLAEFLESETYWLAWGEADNEMENVPESPGTTKLLTEVGRTQELFCGFVIPDENGAIEVGGQKWSPTDPITTPSKFLYLKFEFLEANNSDKVIKQLALYTGTGHDATAGDFLDTQVGGTDELKRNDGTFFEYMNIADITRNDSTKEVFDMILTF